MPKVVIANRLRDGVVVFLAPDSGWAEYVDGAHVADGEQEALELLDRGRQAEARQEVVGAELIPVSTTSGRVTPDQNRDRIRAMGPTVRRDLGKQARS
jgi:hypothetical protein